jgi:sulfur carrier protein
MNATENGAHDAALTHEVIVNGQAHTLAAFSTLADLIDGFGHRPEGIATALNGEFVARGQRRACVLRDGDKVTCFQPIVGG